MTVLCVTTTGIPGIRRCRISGQHRVSCWDHEGWSKKPGVCRGCLPRVADRGHLCNHCYERVIDAAAAWPRFRQALEQADGRLVSGDGGPGATPDGYSNLTLTFLAVDECERHRESLAGRTVDVWVQTEAGARDALMFAVAAENAYRALEVAERERKVEHVRCPGCDVLSARNPTRTVRGVTIVECQHCGYVIDEIRLGVNRWFGSATCEHRLHAECVNMHCICPCHQLGSASRPGGLSAAALWDADLHTVTTRRRAGDAVRTYREPRGGQWVTHRVYGDVETQPDSYRAEWIIRDALTITPVKERRAA